MYHNRVYGSGNRIGQVGEKNGRKSRKKGIKSKIRLKKFFYITSLTLFGKYNLR